MQQTIKLSGLTCPACKKLIEKRLIGVPGINLVEVSLATQEAKIDTDHDVQLEEITEVLKDTPYQVIN